MKKHMTLFIFLLCNLMIMYRFLKSFFFLTFKGVCVYIKKLCTSPVHLQSNINAIIKCLLIMHHNHYGIIEFIQPVAVKKTMQ